MPALIFYFIACLYALIILYYFIGWKRLPSFQPVNDSPVNISVIIPVRNEESSIEMLLTDLLQQKKQQSEYEILVIDDHSTDQTAVIAKNLTKTIANLTVLELPTKTTGKKNAIHLGIKHSHFQYIITLDGDTRVGENWLPSICWYLQAHNPSMLVMPVTFTDNRNLFSKMQSIEFMSLVGSGAGAIGMKQPIFCNGANLAFKKESYYQYHSNPCIPSGDDTLLLLNIKKATAIQSIFSNIAKPLLLPGLVKTERNTSNNGCAGLPSAGFTTTP
jgi:cellulose synthase/poly-beta-1,6-N-acetylglucosamine synthase-like glycosyltransferase